MSGFNDKAISYNGSNEANSHQFFSGYSNGPGSLNRPEVDQIRAVPKFDNVTEQYPHQQTAQFGVGTFQQVPPRAIAVRSSCDVSPQQPVAPFATPLASPTNIFSGLPVGWQNDDFWSQKATFVLLDGRQVLGTVAQLYRFPEAHKSIWKQYKAWHGAKPESIAHPQPQRPIPDDQMAQVTKAAQTFRQTVTKPSAPKKKPRNMAVSAGFSQVPAYAPDDDLDTPQKCRDYLAYIDPGDAHHLRFTNDDWQDTLSNRKHEFIGGIFGALAHPYSQNPPAGITLSQEGREKYYRQQEVQLTKVISQLQTPAQIKAAKAVCSLLFDAAVYVHEVGVPKEVWELYQWYAIKERQIDRKCRLDLESICSTRVSKIIEAVKRNKLIAMDVLEQTNFHRMARDPDFYLLEKFTYLRSNRTRQENIDRHNREDEEKARFEELMTEGTEPTPAKGKRRREQGSDGGQDEMELE